MKLDLWTLALQAINVLLLLWLLHRFLYQPIRRVLAQRQALSTQRLQEVQAAQLRLDQEHAALAASRSELAQARQRAEDDAKSAAAAERARLLALAEAEAAERLRAAHGGIAAERKAAEQALIRQAGTLAVDIATKLLSPPAAAARFDVFLGEACQALAALAPELRTPGDAGVEVLSAGVLDAAAQTECRQRLQAILGAETPLHFRVEPALIAGVELHLPHTVIRRHWAHDLAQILAALQTDGHAA